MFVWMRESKLRRPNTPKHTHLGFDGAFTKKAVTARASGDFAPTGIIFRIRGQVFFVDLGTACWFLKRSAREKRKADGESVCACVREWVKTCSKMPVCRRQ